MGRYLTKKEVEQQFKELILPSIRQAYEQDGRRDIPARREAWNNFTDSLRTDGQISEAAYNNWSAPAICG